jgi:secreted trypsin-like serine protease
MKNTKTVLMRFLSVFAILLISQNANSSTGNQQELIIEQLSQIMEDGWFDNGQLSNRFTFNDAPSNAPSPFILGGTDAGRNVYPEYTLLIFTDGRGNITGLCGGSMIASDKLLTAAHCAQNSAATYFAIPGFYSFNDRITSNNLIQINRVVNHPSYSQQGFDFDVAVMTLTRTTSVPSARLVRGNNLFDGDQGTVIGTGLTATVPADAFLDVLQEVAAPIISNEQCTNNYTRLAGIDPITANMVCAGFSNNSNGTCSGDSGGPLFVDVRGQRAIAGVVSFGFATCEANRATDVYTRMTAFTDFIHSQSPNTVFIKSNSLVIAPVLMLLE